MKEDEVIHSDVINYLSAEFDALEERLKTGELKDYKERVLVSRKIAEAVHLLSPYVRSDARARHLVKNAESLKKELLSVRDMMRQHLMGQKDQPALLQALAEPRKEGEGEETAH